MKPLRCAAIDDEPLALKLIANYVSKTPQLEPLQIFDDAVKGADFLKKSSVDLLFIDIDMPDISGLQLVAGLETRPIVIFTTAYKTFAFDAFELDAMDYLLKPIDFDRFSKAVQKAIDFYQYTINSQQYLNESIFIRSEYKLVKIILEDIVYIEGLEDYVKIHLLNARPVLSLMTMKAVLEKLPNNKFIRIHRSYIIPIVYIRSVQQKKIILQNGAELPVGESYREAVNILLKKP